MSTQILEVETTEGIAKFEVEDHRPPGPERVASDGRRSVAKLAHSLEDILRPARPAAEAVVETFRAMAPDEIEVEFGLEVDAEAGVVFAKSGAKAHFTVSLKWTSASS
ncbi:CU044_2847 family protein [Baekduia sp. Peel2402]|uniref:CU044_2847 family protein n=1 Tax=Baekduia sp. Peel2402 TaxID=3458296 RepID=UPI00403E68F3